MKTFFVELELFGAFRKHGDTYRFAIEGIEAATIRDVRETFMRKLDSEKELIEKSVFSTDVAILKDSDAISEHAKLSILPPVCGG